MKTRRPNLQELFRGETKPIDHIIVLFLCISWPMAEYYVHFVR